MGKQNNEYGSKYVYNTSTGAYGEGDASTETGARRRKLSQKDYEKILESLAKSNASDAKLTSYLHSRGVADADIDLLMADRKKKIQSSDSTSPSKVTGLSLVFPETEKMVAQVEKEGSFLVGDPLKVSQQAIQYDIQQNEQNKKVIQAVSYNSFLEYENLMKDIIGDEKYNNPNEMFELLVDKDEEYQNEVLPYKNAIARVDLQIAEELGVLDAYKSGIQRRTSKKSLEDSWAPFSSMTASKMKLSKEQIGAIQAVNNEIQKRGVKMATEYDTDDFVQKASEIRDKYRSKYGSQFSEVFQKNFKGTIPEQYANNPFALKKIEDYMHQMNSSVDLNGDGRVYQRGTALGRGYNQFVLGTFEMVADVANVIADQTDNEDFKKLASETKQQILDKKTQEGTVENQGFSLSDFVTGEGGSVTGLINKTVSLTSQSLPYMMGVGATQKVATKAGLTLLGSKTLAKYTASTVGMGTISAASAYSNGMGQEWFEELSPIGKLGYSSIHGLAEGGGETVSFALFNKMIAPVLKTGTQATKQTFTEFIKGATKAYGWNVSEEIIAESATALVQTTAEILARGEEVTWEKLNDRVVEAIEGAILMTSGLQGTTTAVRAPFEVQNLHISSKLGLGDTKLRSRAIITRLSDEYVKENDERRKGIIGEQLAKALYSESVRNKQNVDFFEAIRKQSPEDHARLLEIADSFDKKVDTWKSMEEGTAKSVLGAEIKDMFKEKLSIEEKYKDITGEAAPVNATPEAAAIARKINSGESLTLDEETFYAENQAEVEEAVSNVGIRELYVPFEMDGKVEPTIELTEENRDATMDNLINNAETLGEDVFKGFRTTREAVIKGLESVKGAMRAIKTVNPNAKFFVHTSAEAFKKATGLKKLSRGYYKSGNTVHFLAPAMTSTTGYHESTHAAFMETLGAKSYDKLFGEIVRSLRNSPEGLIAGNVIQNFIQGYNPEGRSEEGVTEFIAMLAAGEIDVQIEKGILRKMAEVMGSVLPFNVSIPSRTQGVQIMKDIADSMKEGAPVDPDKIQKLKARKDKGQEAGDKAQIIGESGNLRPEISGRLEQAKQFYDMIKEVRSEEETERILQESFGWTVGADGKWRYEIEYPTIKAELQAGTNIKGAKLSDIIDTELFEVYPESKDIVIDINVSEDGTGRAEAWYSPSQNTIEIQVKTPSAVRTYLVHELQHWVQHREMMATGGSYQTFFGNTQESQKLYEQIIEPLKPFMKARDMARYLDWFAEGAEMSGFEGNYNDMVNMSPEQIVEASDDILDEEQAEELIEFLSNLDEDILNGMTENIEENGWWEYKGHEYMANAAFDYWGEVVRKSDSANGYQLYQRLAGEVESRNAETRSYYSVEQLRQKPLSTTEDVAREDQILVYPQIDITKQNFEDGTVAAQADESFISPEAGKAQVITGDAPTLSLQEALKKTEGRVLVITSDNTGIGEVNGKDVMGGIGYSFIEENLRDGVGFASVSQESVTKIKNMVQSIGKGKDVTILIMQQAPDGMLGNFYAADYLAEAITETFKDDRKQAATEIKERLMSLTPINSSGELDLVEKFIDGIANGYKSEAVAEVVDKMSFPLRKAIVKSLLPKGYGKIKGVERINPNARVAVSLSKRIAEAGFSQVDFWRKYSSPETKTDEYIEGALNGDWGYTYSGFVTNPSLDWGESFQKNNGITHPQFNAKLPSKQTFKLDGGYQVDEAFKNLLTFGYNQEKGMYTVPPFGLKQSTSQSIFAGSFQKSTQEAVLDLISKPDTDPFNQYYKLSSTPEGKAQIIGEIGAMASGKLEMNLMRARDMEAAGKEKEAIFFATGWYRGLDNLWRSEINYGFVRRSLLNGIEDGSIDLEDKYETTLEEFIDAKALFELYPSLRNYTLSIEKIAGSTLGYHNPSKRKIAISRDDYFEKSPKGGYKMKKKKGKRIEGKTDYSRDFYGFMNTVYHEIQHAVQSIEGFSDGYSTNLISWDSSQSKKRSRNTANAQLKAVNWLTEKMLTARKNGLDFLSTINELRDISGLETSSEEKSAGSRSAANIKSLINFAESKGDVKEATMQNKGAFEFINAGSYKLEKSNPKLYQLLRDGMDEYEISRNWTEEHTEAYEEFRSNLMDWYKKNKKVVDLMVDMYEFYKKFNPRNYNTSFITYGKDTHAAVLRDLGSIGQGAAMNVARYSEIDSGYSFKMKPTSYDVYRMNLGEAEARLVGNRGTTKLKDRKPLFSQLHPDVSNDEIWMPPPAKIFESITKKYKEIKKLEKEEKQLDEELMAQDDRDDKEKELMDEKSRIEKTIDVLYSKMDEQLKTAPIAGKRKGKSQLIEGTFEDALFRKETQEELIRAGVDNFFQSDSGVNRLFEHLRFKFADKYRPLQNLQTAIEKEKNRLERTDSNFRRAEALMHGKAAEDARQFEEKQLKPLMDKMVEYGVTNEQISEYLYALHAYERNEFVKNTIDPANEAGSGMTNEVAEEIKKKYAGQKEKMDELAEMAYTITQASRDMMLEFGLISKAQHDSFKMFEHYVPLVGTAVTPTSDLFDFADSRSAQDGSKGSGIAIFGKEYRSVTGRFSEAQSPLETIVSNHLRTISRARKNEVLQTLLNLVTENKDNRVWEVFTEEKPDMRVRVSSKGTSIFIEEATGEDYEYTLRRKMAAIAMAGNPDYVPVKVNGKTSYIKFRDSRITRVLNAGGVGKTNAFVKGLSVASRWFTKVFTSYNPEFIFANLTRDVQTAMFNQMAEQNMQLSTISGQDFVTQSFRGVPAAIQSVYQFERGNRKEMNAEMRGFYEEYLASGAKTDWFFLKTAEQVEADMLKYIRRTAPITSEASLKEKARRVGEKGTATMENVGEFVDILNTSIENGVRFSAYVAARKNGVDVDKAAEFVKELTINFNRSGEMGTLANSFYLFFNASVQGSTRMMRSLIKSKKARQVAAGMTAFSSLLTMMNIAVGGEDEDGIPFYDKIPDYEKERFLIIMYGNGKYGKIPLPYGINIFFNLGTSVSELAMGVSKPSEVASYMMNSVVQSFSPVSISSSENFGYGLMKTLSPTVLKPITELSINEDYFGNRIYKDDFYFGADTPDATRFDKNTAEWAKSMAQFINEATGGSEYESGLIDWSPDSIEYLFTFMGGGAAKFAQRTAKATTKIAKGKADEIEVNDVPLARLFLGTVRENEAAGRYYETRKELLKEKNKIKGAVKSGKAITPEMRKINTLLGYEKKVQAEVKKLGTLEKKALQIEDVDKREQALKAIRDRKIKAYKWFNARYYALMKNETK